MCFPIFEMYGVKPDPAILLRVAGLSTVEIRTGSLFHTGMVAKWACNGSSRFL
jgi:hypothetical protein